MPGSLLTALGETRDRPGLVGKPALPKVKVAGRKSKWEPTWQRAVLAARELRKAIGLREGRVRQDTLLELLGLPGAAGADGEANGSGLGIPQSGGRIKFLSRKRHPVSRRFELSRFIADIIQTRSASTGSPWLASTDLSTARQKFQRTFAAEFLCPIDELKAFLDGDYSESAIKDAAAHFDVSERTVESLLANNGVMPSVPVRDVLESRSPYPLGI